MEHIVENNDYSNEDDAHVVLKRVSELHCADDNLEAQKEALRQQMAVEIAEYDAIFRADKEESVVQWNNRSGIVEEGRVENKISFKSADKIKLDVGGECYTTTVATLRSIPGSKLDKFFSGRFPLDPPVSEHDDDVLFIDRDGVIFREILNYLRDPEVYQLPSREDTLRSLLLEARFYGLSDLADKIDPPFCKSISMESSILDDPMKQMLLKMIMIEQGRSMTANRIYAHIGSSNNTGFEAALSNKGDIVIVVESTNGCVFGAYVRGLDCRLRSFIGHYTMGHPDNFLFSLGWRGVMTPPLKLLASRKNKNLYLCHDGLHMWTDFVVSCTPGGSFSCIPAKYCTVAPGYALPPSETLQEGTLCGSPGNGRYTPRKTEVFSVDILPE
mmetsp:Transcript_8769/g.14932  ORF Transcript_8769/g.14932 Transcript_8769/m.14932 type:complete len:386 (-) Transcript_8769:104-1261(-)